MRFFRRSQRRSEDFMRILVSGIIIFFSVVAFTNRGPVFMEVTNTEYEGYFSQGGLQEQILSPEGVELVQDWIMQRTHPTLNPVTILLQHARFDGASEKYELVLGLSPKQRKSMSRYYGFYLNGNRLYFRVEPIGTNRILIADFTPEELEAALSPYIVEG